MALLVDLMQPGEHCALCGVTDAQMMAAIAHRPRIVVCDGHYHFVRGFLVAMGRPVPPPAIHAEDA